MFGSLRSRLRSVAVVFVVALGLVTTVAAPANAGAWVWLDRFENQYPSWQFENPDPSSRGSFEPTYGPAHSGTRYANLARAAAGWNSVTGLIRPPVPQLAHSRCTVQAWFGAAAGTRYNIEIIDPATWTYVAVGDFTAAQSNVWRQSYLNWNDGPHEFVLRFVLFSPGGWAPVRRLKVDDVEIFCTTY